MAQDRLNPLQRLAREQADAGVRAPGRTTLNISGRMTKAVRAAIAEAGGGGGIPLGAGPGADSSR
jgi:hypothetical protein